MLIDQSAPVRKVLPIQPKGFPATDSVPALIDMPDLQNSGICSTSASALPPGGVQLLSQVLSSLVTESSADREATMAEEQAKWIPGASNTFVSIMKRVITANNYDSQPLVSNVPHLKSDDDTPTPSVHRLPLNPYILAKLNQHRAQVLDASRAKPGSTQFA